MALTEEGYNQDPVYSSEQCLLKLNFDQESLLLLYHDRIAVPGGMRFWQEILRACRASCGV